MARTEARIRTLIWENADFKALDPLDQWAYFLLLSQPTLNLCGVAPYQLGRWSHLAENIDVDELDRRFDRLADARFVVIDSVTEEICIRTFLKWDGIIDKPNMIVAMSREFPAVSSPSLRSVIVDQLGPAFIDDLVVPKDAKPWNERLDKGFLEWFRKHFTSTVEPMPEPFMEPIQEPFPGASSERMAEPFREPIQDGFSIGAHASSAHARGASASSLQPPPPPPPARPGAANGHDASANPVAEEEIPKPNPNGNAPAFPSEHTTATANAVVDVLSHQALDRRRAGEGAVVNDPESWLVTDRGRRRSDVSRYLSEHPGATLAGAVVGLGGAHPDDPDGRLHADAELAATRERFDRQAAEQADDERRAAERDAVIDAMSDADRALLEERAKVALGPVMARRQVPVRAQMRLLLAEEPPDPANPMRVVRPPAVAHSTPSATPAPTAPTATGSTDR